MAMAVNRAGVLLEENPSRSNPNWMTPVTLRRSRMHTSPGDPVARFPRISHRFKGSSQENTPRAFPSHIGRGRSAWSTPFSLTSSPAQRLFQGGHLESNFLPV